MTPGKKIVPIVILISPRIFGRPNILRRHRTLYLHDMYNGVTRLAGTEETCLELGGQWKEGIEPGSDGNVIEKCHIGHGVLVDLNPQCADDELACDDPNISEAHAPTNFGGCADCHAPGINGQLMGRNLHDAVGLAYDAGVHCDTCHKVRDVDMSKPAGYGSRLVVHRPGEPGRTVLNGILCILDRSSMSQM